MGKAIDDEVLLALAKKSGGGGGGTDDYEDLAHKPQVNGHTLEGNKTTSDLGIKFEDLPDAPTIPNDLADLQDDSTHRLVTDTEKATWNGKSNFSGSYNDLTDKPTIPSQLYAGDYIEIDENDKINVKLQKGDFTEYEYRLTGAYSPVNQLTIEKYRDGVLVNTESYVNTTAYTPIAIDGLFEIWYSAGNPRYYWCYKLLEDSQEHSAGYEDLWYYTDTATRMETFDVDDDSLTLVRKGDLDYADLPNKPSINGVELSGNKTTSDLGITASGVGAIPSTDKGANGGVAELDSNGLVPASQLPSYVDDVLSYASQSAFPATGETGKIYIAEDTNKTYRWSGSAYAEISASLALGETSSTAYRGDRGKTAYDHSQTTGNPHGTTKGDVGLGNVPNVTTNDQTPTFTEASTRNNIASGEKLSVILGKIQKFFNDLKTVAFSGKYTDLTNKPENANTFQGTIAEWNQLTTAEKKAYDHASIPDSIDGGVTFPANKVIMTGGGNVEDRVDAHTFGERVDISSATSSNKYTAPSDGYLFVGGSSTGSYVTFTVEGKIYLTATQGNAQYNSLYVKKGTQMWDVTHNGTYVAYFCPLE